MSEAIQFIQLDDNEDSLKMMKMMVAAMMKEWQNQVITLDTPKEEEYTSIEEYKKAYNDFMLETINDIKGVKYSIFNNINTINNNFLELIRKTQRAFEQEKIRREQVIRGAKRDIAISAVAATGLSMIFPGALPYLLIINIPKVGIEIYAIRKNKNRIEVNMGVEKRLSELETDLNFLTCDLREDYHKTEKELEELKIQLLEGKDIKEGLINLFDPKRVGLTPLTEEEFKQIPFEEKPKEYKKENQ